MSAKAVHLVPVTLLVAEQRLRVFRQSDGYGPHRASTLADVIWPEAKWRSPQGAGAAATRVLKKLGCYWTNDRSIQNWGWMLMFSTKPTP